MPKLHKYKDKDGFYVLTATGNNIVIFQLSSNGTRRLLEAGIMDGIRFRRAILFDLYRSGDAYTRGTGPGVIEPYEKGQLDLDFLSDPEPETIFPRCSLCGALDDMHLVEIRDERGHYVSLYCPLCRKKASEIIDTSIPLKFVSRSVFEEILDLKGIKNLDNSASDYRASLEKAFNEMWEKLTEKKLKGENERQEMLFDANEEQKKLL